MTAIDKIRVVIYALSATTTGIAGYELLHSPAVVNADSLYGCPLRVRYLGMLRSAGMPIPWYLWANALRRPQLARSPVAMSVLVLKLGSTWIACRGLNHFGRTLFP